MRAAEFIPTKVDVRVEENIKNCNLFFPTYKFFGEVNGSTIDLIIELYGSTEVYYEVYGN